MVEFIVFLGIVFSVVLVILIKEIRSDNEQKVHVANTNVKKIQENREKEIVMLLECLLKHYKKLKKFLYKIGDKSNLRSIEIAEENLMKEKKLEQKILDCRYMDTCLIRNIIGSMPEEITYNEEWKEIMQEHDRIREEMNRLA